MKTRTIKWRDSRIYITQVSKENIEDVCIIKSTGFLIEEDDNKVVLAGDIVDGEYRRVIVIPKENIINLWN